MSTAFVSRHQRDLVAHECNACPDPIEAREMYETWMWADGGHPWRVRVHPGCDALLDACLHPDDTFEADAVPELLREFAEYPAPLESSQWSERERARFRALWARSREGERST